MLRAVVRPASLAPRVARATRAASSSVPKVTFDPADKTPKDKAPGQAPNVPTTWSQNQQPKDAAFNNPRFEQVYVPTQPDSLSAMGLVDEQPIVKVQGRRAVCNGGESEEGWTRTRRHAPCSSRRRAQGRRGRAAARTPGGREGKVATELECPGRHSWSSSAAMEPPSCRCWALDLPTASFSESRRAAAAVIRNGPSPYGTSLRVALVSWYFCGSPCLPSTAALRGRCS